MLTSAWSSSSADVHTSTQQRIPCCALSSISQSNVPKSLWSDPTPTPQSCAVLTGGMHDDPSVTPALRRTWFPTFGCTGVSHHLRTSAMTFSDENCLSSTSLPLCCFNSCATHGSHSSCFSRRMFFVMFWRELKMLRSLTSQNPLQYTERANQPIIRSLTLSSVFSVYTDTGTLHPPSWNETPGVNFILQNTWRTVSFWEPKSLCQLHFCSPSRMHFFSWNETLSISFVSASRLHFPSKDSSC